MKKSILLCFSLLTIGYAGKAQSATPDVVATAGDFYSSATASLSWTLGEIAVETFEGSDNILTQGFQQSDPGTSTGITTAEVFGASVYPNPVSGTLTLQFSALSDELLVELFDMKGSLLHTQLITVFGASLQTIDMSGLPSGLYLLKMTGASNRTQQTLKIQKIN